MKMLIILALFGVALSKESPLKAILKSPVETLKLYSDFKGEQHLKFKPTEDRMRFRLFLESANLVADENSVDGETAEFALNFFSTMTPSERNSFLGFNGTAITANEEPKLSSGLTNVPASKLWTNEGAVTAVKNQGSCGSCWTFGAVGGLETRYQQISGKLRNFAEQEYLDCVYEMRGGGDGCRGGWMSWAYDYSANAGGRLASTADYGYTARDSSCRGSSKPDAMVSAKIRGNVPVARGEAAHIAAIAEGSITVAFEVTNKFQSYSRGILKDTTCSGYANHAVTAVGYTSNYILVKNSWGSHWGDNGYVKFARGYHNCHLYDYSSYPRLEVTNQADNGGNDQATDYHASDDGDEPEPEPEPTCEDSYHSCRQSWCIYDYIREDYCQSTCGNCPCPSGTIRCSDGVCRHEHMC